jgi:hypothetical protein
MSGVLSLPFSLPTQAQQALEALEHACNIDVKKPLSSDPVEPSFLYACRGSSTVAVEMSAEVGGILFGRSSCFEFFEKKEVASHRSARNGRGRRCCIGAMTATRWRCATTSGLGPIAPWVSSVLASVASQSARPHERFALDRQVILVPMPDRDGSPSPWSARRRKRSPLRSIVRSVTRATIGGKLAPIRTVPILTTLHITGLLSSLFSKTKPALARLLVRACRKEGQSGFRPAGRRRA